MLKLHRLKIERFRSVKPCELYFNDGLNILLGRNGSGKTTLLKLITALYTSPIGEILPGEEYELEVEFRFSVGSVVTHIKSALPDLSADSGTGLAISEDPNIFELEVRIDFGAEVNIKARFPHPDQKPSTWLVKLNQLQMNLGLNHSQVSLLGLFQPFLNMMSTMDPFGPLMFALSTEMQQSVLPFRFDESLDALDLIHKRKIGFTSVRGEVHGIGLARGPFPRGYVNLLEKRITADPSTASVILDNNDLDFLKQFMKMTGLQSARMVCESIERRVRSETRNTVWNVFSNFRFSFTRRDGSEFWQDQLSYGQKRLLVFLYYISSIPQVIIADELVNGLHHEWIEACVQAMQGKQAFLTSQNPLLLDHLSFENQEEVRKTFLLCSATPQPSGDVTQWKNMSETEAEIFYQAYKVGIQHVSEILHSEGLW